uniref:small monomeric GTPase n=1 Tax=Hucho hucho TaxID=62062 RepID=A0A4W5QIZ1_9TELE
MDFSLQLCIGGQHPGVASSRLTLRLLTHRFLMDIFSVLDSLYRKRLSIDGRQLNLEVFDPCSQPVEWADGFVVVYNISNRTSFINAENILQQIRETRIENFCLVGNKQDLCHARQIFEQEGRSLAQDNHCLFQEVSAAESYQEIANLFTQLIRQVMEHLKYRADRRRYSSSKSMAKLINNMFGKRRKSM